MLDIASTSRRLAKDVGTPVKGRNFWVLFIFCVVVRILSAHRWTRLTSFTALCCRSFSVRAA